jgi:hypothetical protein
MRGKTFLKKGFSPAPLFQKPLRQGKRKVGASQRMNIPIMPVGEGLAPPANQHTRDDGTETKNLRLFFFNKTYLQR